MCNKVCLFVTTILNISNSEFRFFPHNDNFCNYRNFHFHFFAAFGGGQFAYCGKLRGASWRGDGLLQEASELLRIIAKIAATCQFPKANAASELCQMIGKNSILPKSWSVNQRSTAVSLYRQNKTD